MRRIRRNDHILQHWSCRRLQHITLQSSDTILQRLFKLFYLFISTSTVVSSMTNDVRAMLELDDNRN